MLEIGVDDKTPLTCNKITKKRRKIVYFRCNREGYLKQENAQREDYYDIKMNKVNTKMTFANNFKKYR